MLLFRSEQHVDNWCRQWGRSTRWNPLAAAWLETRPVVVWRPPQPHVAADDFRRSPIRFRRSRPTWRLLEAGLTTEPVDSTAGLCTHSKPLYNRPRAAL